PGPGLLPPCFGLAPFFVGQVACRTENAPARWKTSRRSHRKRWRGALKVERSGARTAGSLNELHGKNACGAATPRQERTAHQKAADVAAAKAEDETWARRRPGYTGASPLSHRKVIGPSRRCLSAAASCRSPALP